MTMAIQTHNQTHEYHAMKPQPKWQDGSILILAGILAGSENPSPWGVYSVLLMVIGVGQLRRSLAGQAETLRLKDEENSL